MQEVELMSTLNTGIGATARMRDLELTRKLAADDHHTPMQPARILALTGMSSLEDKRRAFEAGVDG